jgi:chromatin structure-remodeling complex subunit RSC1/2
MHRNLYSSPQAVAYDLFLIWSNAREYNEQGSLVYADADKLEVRPMAAIALPEKRSQQR